MTDVAAMSISRVHRAISIPQHVPLQAQTLFIGLGVSHALMLCIMWVLFGNLDHTFMHILKIPEILVS